MASTDFIEGLDARTQRVRRLLALEANGTTHVECSVVECDDLHAELMEIDENLSRSDLSAAQQISHILRRKAVWEEIGASFGTNSSETVSARGRLGEGRPRSSFAAEVAATTGDVKQVVNRKLARGRELGDDRTQDAERGRALHTCCKPAAPGSCGERQGEIDGPS